MEVLEHWLHKTGLTNQDCLSIVLSTKNGSAKSAIEIKKLAVDAGFHKAKDWNIGRIISNSNKIINTASGYKLRKDGWNRLKEIGYDSKSPIVTPQTTKLQTKLNQIQDPNVKDILEEALKCYEVESWRGVICLTWQAAIGVLHLYVINNKLSDFNAAGAARRQSSRNRWKIIQKVEDLQEMKEFEFIDLLPIQTKIIDKNVKNELKRWLSSRNSCSHPNSYKASESIAAACIESLVDHVFTRVI